MDDTHPTGGNAIIHGVEALVLAGEPMKLSDFPGEILDNIMFHLSKRAQTCNGVMFPSSADIKNVRLSCHSLSAAASRHLIDRLKVEVSPSSLSRLEEISEHPLIRHSVQGVELCLAQYDSIFDDGVQGLIKFIQSQLIKFIHTHPLRPLIPDPYPRPPAMVLKARDICEGWSEFLSVLRSGADTLLGSLDEEIGAIQDLARDFRHTGALLEGYHQYRIRLREQASLQQDQGGFVARVSASMAKLTRVKGLRITDWDATTWGPQSGAFELDLWEVDLSSDSSIVDSLAGSRRPFAMVEGVSLLSMIPDLVCTGKNIEILGIQISPEVSSYTELTLSTSQQAELRSGLKKLQIFRFHNYNPFPSDPSNEADGICALGQFIDSCLVSDNLKAFFIKAKIRYENVTRSLFTPRPWPKLQSVGLLGLPASAADLDVLTKSLASNRPRGYLYMKSVRLYCGATWASILDMLRSSDIYANLDEHQFGAEFEESPDLCEKVFSPNLMSSGSMYPSFAKCYVHGMDMKNPLLEFPDQDLCRSLFGDDFEGSDESSE